MPQRRYYRPKKKKRKILLTLIKISGVAVFLMVLIGIGTFVIFAKDLPDPERIDERFISQSTKIYDSTGKIILYDIHGEEKRTLIPFLEIPQYVKDATIAIEDQGFYQHIGIDIRAIAQAVITRITNGGRLRGASTITQQFIKNSILSPERSLSRKIKEAILAIELERKYTKDEILGFYLNQISYGSNAYGIEAASQTFFSKSARDLTLAESALLAALPNAPTYYSPYGSHQEDLITRKNLILEKMRELGFISREEEEAARNEPLEFSKARTSINAPHFVFYVRELLEERYGEDYLSRAGLKVITTLNWDLQQLAEKVVREGGDRNEPRGAYNAALVSVDPKTGQILAMVGSRDYFEDPKPAGCSPGLNCKFEPHVNVAIRDRQPGSAFKPFVYATALKKGYTDSTILFDVPTEFNVNCDAFSQPTTPGAECYNPGNYDNVFRGPMTTREALANSVNVPSVKLLYLAGVNDSINTAQDMGISTLKDRSRFGLSLVLGGGEVKLLDLTSAFGVFATEGIRHPARAILRIENDEGEILEEFDDEPREVLNPEVARTISDILSDNKARIPVFGVGSPLEFKDRDVAAKTGTTNEYRDGWTIGYSPSIAAGIWVGNNDNSPIINKPGAYVAAPIWRAFMDGAIEKLSLPPESFTPPEERVVSKPVLSGQYNINGEVHNILYYISKDDPQGPPPQQQDVQFPNWEAAVQRWLGNNFIEQEGIVVSINFPTEKQVVMENNLNIEVSLSTTKPVGRVEFIFDDKKIGSIEGAQPVYKFSIVIPQETSSGDHAITVRAYGQDPNIVGEATRTVVIP